MSSQTYYRKDDVIYEYYHGILIPVQNVNPQVPIVDHIQDAFYVKRPRLGKAFYNENFFFKLMTPDGIEVYHRLGRHPGFPSLFSYWEAGDDKYMVMITKLSGSTIVSDQLSSLSSQDYYSVVNQALTSLDYVHSLGIVLDDRASPDNSLYDARNNTFYHIDIDESVLYDPEKGIPDQPQDMKEVIFILLWLRNSSIEKYRGQDTLDFDIETEYEDNFFITDDSSILAKYLMLLIRDTQDIHLIQAYRMMLGFLAPINK